MYTTMHYAQFTRNHRVLHTHTVCATHRVAYGSQPHAIGRELAQPHNRVSSAAPPSSQLLSSHGFSPLSPPRLQHLLLLRCHRLLIHRALDVAASDESGRDERTQLRQLRVQLRAAHGRRSPADVRSVHRRVTPVPEGPRRGSRCNGDALWAMHARVTDNLKKSNCVLYLNNVFRSLVACPPSHSSLAPDNVHSIRPCSTANLSLRDRPCPRCSHMSVLAIARTRCALTCTSLAQSACSSAPGRAACTRTGGRPG